MFFDMKKFMDLNVFNASIRAQVFTKRKMANSLVPRVGIVPLSTLKLETHDPT